MFEQTAQRIIEKKLIDKERQSKENADLKGKNGRTPQPQDSPAKGV